MSQHTDQMNSPLSLHHCSKSCRLVCFIFAMGFSLTSLFFLKFLILSFFLVKGKKWLPYWSMRFFHIFNTICWLKFILWDCHLGVLWPQILIWDNCFINSLCSCHLSLHCILEIIPYFGRSSHAFFLKFFFFCFSFQFLSRFSSLFFFFFKKTCSSEMNLVPMVTDWGRNWLQMWICWRAGALTDRPWVQSHSKHSGTCWSRHQLLAPGGLAGKKRIQYKITPNRASQMECSPGTGVAVAAMYLQRDVKAESLYSDSAAGLCSVRL